MEFVVNVEKRLPRNDYELFLIQIYVLTANETKKGLTIITEKSNSLKKYLLLFLLFLSLDQFSKIIIRKIFSNNVKNSYNIIGNFFRITYTENPGAVFGISIGSGILNQLIFITASIVAIFILIYLFLKHSHPLVDLGFIVILSGAVGNLIDRIAFGKVTDFLDFDFFDFIVDRWYTFNIADSCIVVGVIILMIYYGFLESSTVEKKKILEKE